MKWVSWKKRYLEAHPQKTVLINSKFILNFQIDEPVSDEDEVESDKDDKSKSRGRKKRAGESHSKSRESISDKVLEARRDFDEALEKIKGQGSRRKLKMDLSDPAVHH